MRHRRETPVAELDVIPVMSLIVHLIPMLLLSVRFVVLASVPGAGPVLPSRPATDPGQTEKQEAEVVSVSVTGSGFVVGGAGLADPRVPCDGACGPETYDYAALGRAMIEAKRLHPAETRVVIAPEPAIAYDVLIRVMDSTRSRSAGDKEETLFPDALLAAPVEAP